MSAMGPAEAYYRALIPNDRKAADPAGSVDPKEERRNPRRPKGGSGVQLINGVVQDLDHNTATTGDLWYGDLSTIGIATKMRRDPYVNQAIDVITSALRAIDWSFQPASDDPLDQEVADFCNLAFIECMPWDQTVRMVAAGYNTYGFFLGELEEQRTSIDPARFPNHPSSSDAIVGRKLHNRPPWSVHKWIQSKRDPTELTAVVQQIAYGDMEDGGFLRIPSARLLRWTLDQDGADFTGNATIRPAYGAWLIKQALLQIDAIKHERTGAGTPTITGSADASEDDISAAIATLEELRVNARSFMYLPEGWEFEWATSNGSESTDLHQAIMRCNQDILFVATASWMLLGQGATAGSYALATTHQGQYNLAIDGQARFFADVWNRGSDGWSPVERLVRINYGTGVRPPRLVAKNIPTRDWFAVWQATVSMAQAGLVTGDDVLEAQFRESMRLPAMDSASARERMTTGTFEEEAEAPVEEEGFEEEIFDDETDE